MIIGMDWNFGPQLSSKKFDCSVGNDLQKSRKKVDDKLRTSLPHLHSCCFESHYLFGRPLTESDRQVCQKWPACTEIRILIRKLNMQVTHVVSSLLNSLSDFRVHSILHVDCGSSFLQNSKSLDERQWKTFTRSANIKVFEWSETNKRSKTTLEKLADTNLWVWAPQYLSAGTRNSPNVSCSVR